MRRSVGRLLGTYFFEEELPVYVNRAAESFDMLEHTHDFVELTYVCEGAGVHYIGEHNMRVSRGDVFFIPVGVSHVFRPAAPGRGRELIVYNCIFPIGYLLHLERLFPDTAPLLARFREPGSAWFKLRDSGEFHGWFKSLYREYTARQPGCEAVLTALVIRILVELYRKRADESPSRAGEDSDKAAAALFGHTRSGSSEASIGQAMQEIEQRYAETLTLGELARQAGLSERQFSRLFVRQTGLNFSTFLQNTRVEAACALLSSSNMGIAEIAAAVGYGDLKFFYRLFKRKTGVTPMAYRRNG
ncbi:AraC family transcriptional regulator [Saccharibacillus deserti]|uniref:AraC family transcriptional regulator n=1 Tax=Saccharibacillus deserti TaxID=1634444 RepID=UPI0031B5DC0F